MVSEPLADRGVAHRWRRQELFLLSCAAFIVGCGLVVVDLSTVNHVQAVSIRLLLAFIAAAVLIHVAIRRRARFADPFIAPAALLLAGIGLVEIHRLDIAEQVQAITSGQPVPVARAPLQSLWAVVGAALFIATLLVVRDHRRLQRFPWLITLCGLALLLSPLVPGIGHTIRGATLWVRIGGLSIQPAEAAKVLLPIGFSAYLTRHGRALALLRCKVAGLPVPRLRDFAPLLVMWVASLGVLIFQRDLGTSLLFFGLFVVLLYASTAQRSWPLIGLALFLVGSLIGWVLFAHVQLRVLLWLNPFRGDGTSQVALGLYGIADGGLFGTGLGQGYPSLVPFAESDYIFSSISEELGLVGFLACLLLYAVLAQRGLRAAQQSRDTFGSLLGISFATVVALQTFVVIGGVTRLIPLTGLTTPFMSYGGSSLVANLIIMGMLIRLSDSVRAPRAAFKQAVFSTGPVPVTSPNDATEAISIVGGDS